MSEPPDQPLPGLASGELQDRAVQGAAWTMVHTVISIPIAFAVNLLLARVLAPDGYGRLAFLTTLIAIAGSVVALGLSSALIQFGAKAHAAGRTSDVQRMLSAAQGFRLLVVAPILTLLVVIFVDVSLPLLLLAIVFGVWVPAALDGAPITLFIENKTAAGAKITLVAGLLVQAAVVIAVLWVGTADAVWSARVMVGAVGIGLALVAISRAYRRAVLRPRLPRGFPPGFWRFAIPTGAAALIGDLALSRTEVLYLTWLSTPEAVGLFALAFGVAGHVFAPAHALTGPLLPAISGITEVEPDKVAAAFGRTLRASATVVSLLVVTAVPALAVLVPLLYGEDFAAAAPAVLVLGIVGGLAVLAGPVSAFVMARLSARVILGANLSALAVNLAVALTLIPTIGMWGAVASNAAASLTQLLVLLISERRALGVGAAELLGFLTPALLAAGATATGWAITHPLGLPRVVEAVIAVAVASGLLLVGLRLTHSGLDGQDRDAVARALPRRAQPAASSLLSLVVRR